ACGGRVRSSGLERLMRTERIARYRLKLIRLESHCEVCALAADERQTQQCIAGELPFRACAPLLNVRPSRLGRDGCHVERKRNGTETLLSLIAFGLTDGTPTLWIDLSHA